VKVQLLRDFFLVDGTHPSAVQLTV